MTKILEFIKSIPKLIIRSPPKWYWCFFFRKNPILGSRILENSRTWIFPENSLFIPSFWVSEDKNEIFRIQPMGVNPSPNRHIIYEPKIPMQRPLYHTNPNYMLLSTLFRSFLQPNPLDSIFKLTITIWTKLKTIFNTWTRPIYISDDRILVYHSFIFLNP